MSGQNHKDNKRNPKAQLELPAIPDKLYFTIGEVSKLCDLKAHVLRYWEQEFPELSPSKRRGNRRYYQRRDILLVRRIRSLLYDQGFTIEGARTQLGESTIQNNPLQVYQILQTAITDLEGIVAELEA